MRQVSGPQEPSHHGWLQPEEEAAMGFEDFALPQDMVGRPSRWGCCGSKIRRASAFSGHPPVLLLAVVEACTLLPALQMSGVDAGFPVANHRHGWLQCKMSMTR